MSKCFLRTLMAVTAFHVLFVLTGCATTPVILDQVLVQNLSGGRVTDVVVAHSPTGKTGSTNLILPGRSLDIGFSRKPLLAQQATVSWRDEAGAARKKTIRLPQRENLSNEEKILRLVYVIGQGGDLSAYFQDSQIAE